MCVASMIADHYRNKFQPYVPTIWPSAVSPLAPPQITREEFDTLRREVAEMKELLIRAKAYDERTKQADCEQTDKIALLRKVADLVGITLDDVFPQSA